MDMANPYPIVYNVGEMLRGFETVRSLADSAAHIIPGHDPIVMERFPSPSAASHGVVARLDVEPINPSDERIHAIKRTT
jgi:hypothetical protein